jgi:hypothetical protein
MRRLVVAVLLGVTACSGGGSAGPAPSQSVSPTPSRTPPSPTLPPVHPSAAATGVTKVLTIVEENHGTASARAGMPYLASLARQYGVATDYRSITHPSLPNYLAMTAGSTFGISDDDGPAAHPVSGPSVFDLALSHGHTAKVYAESMPSNCDRDSSGRYAARHNTWTFFTDSTTCQDLDVPAPDIDADVAAGHLPDVGMLIPDLCHDAHDCSLGAADGYLHDVMRTVLSGPDWSAGRLAVVITFDEVEENDTGTLLTVVVAPGLHGIRISAPLTHLAWSRWMTDLVGAPPLRLAARAPSLGKAFHL